VRLVSGDVVRLETNLTGWSERGWTVIPVGSVVLILGERQGFGNVYEALAPSIGKCLVGIVDNLEGATLL